MDGPIVYVRPMNELSAYKRKKICEHDKQCDKFLVINTLNEGMTLCEKDALVFANNIFANLHVMPEVKLKQARGFTQEQTEELIQYIRNNDIRHGTYVLLAEKFGKTRDQVKSYVWYLRSKGAV